MIDTVDVFRRKGSGLLHHYAFLRQRYDEDVVRSALHKMAEDMEAGQVEEFQVSEKLIHLCNNIAQERIAYKMHLDATENNYLEELLKRKTEESLMDTIVAVITERQQIDDLKAKRMNIVADIERLTKERDSLEAPRGRRGGPRLRFFSWMPWFW